ncbi:pyruvate formate lyase family protein [Christensenella intestinihominis]|uniref:pyruvate formate lyase family protein n=1 Tax=Christensenella intestinihominis TaxID=1851429 RepID=UPI00155F6E26|nr:pyruvate formate lyase family protein [Christensenella intestinihominis]
MSTRTQRLRERTLESLHKQARIAMPDWDVSDYPLSLPERKASAVAMIMERMPLYIGEEELIVGTRTIYGDPGEEGGGKSLFDYNALPHYVNKEDRKYFGMDQEAVSQAHYAPDFGLLLKKGIGGIIKEAEERLESEQKNENIKFYKSVIIAYKGFSRMVERYADFAKEQAAACGDAERRAELETIGEICQNISIRPAGNFAEACQLFWFGYLASLIENFQFINFGRIDQILFEYYDAGRHSEEQQLLECLLLKMYDQADLILLDKNLMGKYSAQHNITIGGLRRDGADGCNEVTRMLLTALKKTRLPEPLISVRTHKNAPEWLFRRAAELTVNGMNCMAYYNDDLYVASMEGVGIPPEDARDYGFGLCQDVLIPGRGDHYCSGGVNLTIVLLDVIRKHPDARSFHELKEMFKQAIAAEIKGNIEKYNAWEEAVRAFQDGDDTLFFEGVRKGRFDPDTPAQGMDVAQAARNEGEEKKEKYIQSLMSPLPVTSALYHGCMEKGTDITRCGCERADKGFMVLSPVVAVNSLVALKKVVFDDRRATLIEVKAACDTNYEGAEELRQWLWNAPKWCNDDDYADFEAKDILEFACREILKYRTPGGGRHLAGIHQPHPVFAGRLIPATPEGRHAGTPIPVTLSPENGTLQRGPTAALKSAAKIDSTLYQWNNCVMLQYVGSAMEGEHGAETFVDLLKSYFRLGGVQHQPNVVNIADLYAAQETPEKYKDLIIRMWGVSAHFVDLPLDVQEEFISRYEGM